MNGSGQCEGVNGMGQCEGVHGRGWCEGVNEREWCEEKMGGESEWEGRPEGVNGRACVRECIGWGACDRRKWGGVAV